MTSVLDASALLALVLSEPGADAVVDAVAAGAAVSTVNLAEVATVLVRRGGPVAPVLDALTAQLSVEPFTEVDAVATAELHPLVARWGLSLGDRACLALAARLGLPAVTANEVWADLALDVTVQLVRPR